MGHKRNLRTETLIDQFERAAVRFYEAAGAQPSPDYDDKEIALIEKMYANAKRQYLTTYNRLLNRLNSTSRP